MRGAPGCPQDNPHQEPSPPRAAAPGGGSRVSVVRQMRESFLKLPCHSSPASLLAGRVKVGEGG
ncbi:hypothetical protein E2C01_093746 [Portunus trituberculatus]|uniref:Uncharacterized protein n=1 Tax=Portunus trituberculatus TaxID=210409 RepID=A0A5B7JZJ7_PORTR|nr:hypothetical protein [Portunus trituberculatus]